MTERNLVQRTIDALERYKYRVRRYLIVGRAGEPDIEAYKMPILFGIECKCIKRPLSPHTWQTQLLGAAKKLQLYRGMQVVTAGGVFILLGVWGDKKHASIIYEPIFNGAAGPQYSSTAVVWPDFGTFIGHIEHIRRSWITAAKGGGND